MGMPDRYGVIGHPIAHSKSPDIHARFAAQTKQDLLYERLPAPLDGFVETVQRFMRQGGKGLNVVGAIDGTRKSRPNWADARDFAERLWRNIAAEETERYVAKMAKAQRSEEKTSELK